MELEKVGFNYRGEEFSLEVHRCKRFEMFSGLMFKRREKAKALLFDFKKEVKLNFHSLFVFFPFVAIWFDDKNRVLDVKKIKPFKINLPSRKPFTKVIEIPINKEYRALTKSLVGDTKSL